MRRRTALAGLGASASFLFPGSARAVEPEVPLRLQTSLLDRVIPFDRNFALRVHGQLSVAVVVDNTNPDSTRVGAQLLGELGALSTLGNYPVTTSRVSFSDVQQLVDECKRLRAGIIYITPGLRVAIPRLAGAFEGLRVLTVGTLPEQARSGLVLGFAEHSGKPRVLVNLGEARKQQVDFRADFLRMAEVLE